MAPERQHSAQLALEMGSSRTEIFSSKVSMAERIRSVDSKSPAELAKLAAEVEEGMQDLANVEPEIREMLVRRQRAMRAKESPAPPRTPEPVEPEKVQAAPVHRLCCCGCGAMLVCGSVGTDSAMTELCRRQLEESDVPPPPPVNASAQRAYCAQLARKRCPTPKGSKNEETIVPDGSRRMPDFSRLHAMAKPREAPLPPPPEPGFRAQPAPSFSRRPKSLTPSFSAPDLPSLGRIGGAETDISLRHKAPEPFCQTPASWGSPTQPATEGSSASQLVELRCHAIRAKSRTNLLSMLPPSPSKMTRLPGLGEDYIDDLEFQAPLEKKGHSSAAAQRNYTDKRLYRKNTTGAPGSNQELQARLDTLKRENQASRDLERQLERTKKRRPARSKAFQYRDLTAVTELAPEIV